MHASPVPACQAANDTQRSDFSDTESHRVFSDAALAIARELGREAAREQFAELMTRIKAPK